MGKEDEEFPHASLSIVPETEMPRKNTGIRFVYVGGVFNQCSNDQHCPELPSLNLLLDFYLQLNFEPTSRAVGIPRELAANI